MFFVSGTGSARSMSEEKVTLVSEEVLDLIQCSKWFVIFYLLTGLR